MKIRRSVRQAADAIACWGGVLAGLRRRAARGFTCLTYHRVLPADRCGESPAPLTVSDTLFEMHAAWLGANASVVTVGEALDRAASGRLDAARPIVCVTFDDGYWDNAAIAAPILERHGLVGTFFVVTDFVETGRPLWFDRAAGHWKARGARACAAAAGVDGGAPASFAVWMEQLKRLAPGERVAVLERLDRQGEPALAADLSRPMTRDDLRRLVGGGHEIGSHTASHPILSQLDDASLADELEGSHRRLREWLGADVPGLAYPNGDCDGRVARAARDAGYRYACTTAHGVGSSATDPMRLPRRHVQESDVTGPGGAHSGAALAAEVWGLHQWLRVRAGLARPAS